jgi:ribosomal protein S18 acetylase RimI-like enzyme
MTIDIRLAAASELSDIARIVVDVWRLTFAGLLPDEFLESMSYSHQEQRHRRYFGRAGVSYYVADDEGDSIVGFASGGLTRHASFPHEGEVYALYLLPAHQRRRIGASLFHKVAVDLEEAGCRGLVAFALDNNPNRDFYARLGGRQAIAEPIVLGSMTVGQVAYLWDDIPALTRDFHRFTE